MARVTVWNGSPAQVEPVSDVEEVQPCPGCRGRGDDDCLTCGGEGFV